MDWPAIINISSYLFEGLLCAMASLRYPLAHLIFVLEGRYFSFFFNKFIYFIYLFLAALGLCCCARAFSSCGERGLLFIAVHGLLISVASLVAEHGL